MNDLNQCPSYNNLIPPNNICEVVFGASILKTIASIKMEISTFNL